MPTIDIRGAREHNLRSVDLSLPAQRLIVFCGVSGSGKSSLAENTIYAEGRLRYVNALSLRMGKELGAPPEVDRIDGLPPTILLAQRERITSAGATLGSLALLDPVLRVLFGRAGVLRCPRCGRAISAVTHDEIVDTIARYPDGSRIFMEAPVRLGEDPAAVLEEIRRAGFSRVRIREEVLTIEEVKPQQLRGLGQLRIVVDRIRLDLAREQVALRARLHDAVRLGTRAGQGAIVAVCDGRSEVFTDRPLCVEDDLLLPALQPSLFSPGSAEGACPRCEGAGALGGVTCDVCAGSRLSEAARCATWRAHTMPELLQRPAAELRRLLCDAKDPPWGPVEAVAVPDLLRLLDGLCALGLGALPLGRAAEQLSGSEQQRARLARQVAASLTGVLYVLDEPTASLDGASIEAVIALMKGLVAAGNTVIAVEHAQAVIRAADHVVEFGPGAGLLGGRVIYEGDAGGLLRAETPTGLWLSGRRGMPERGQTPSGSGELSLSGPWCYGPSAPVSLPRGLLVAITGPAASGKSRLVSLLASALAGEELPNGVVVSGAGGLSRPVLADRAAARSVRSNPATAMGIWDVMRELLASTKEAMVRGLTATAFSLAVQGGRCEACKGTGERHIEMGPLPEVIVRCEVCGGQRFQRDLLEIRWKGMNAAEILALPASEARNLLSGHPKLEGLLAALCRVGLGYLPLGQPAQSLSGGEARRLVLARELASAQRRGARDTAYLLDDPTAGLHPEDTALLVALLRDLVSEGASVWAATADPLFSAASDRTVVLSRSGRPGVVPFVENG